MENDIGLHGVIINGQPSERSLRDYTDKGWVHLATRPATEFHPYAAPTDTVLFFAKPIDKTAYDEEMRRFREEVNSKYGGDTPGNI